MISYIAAGAALIALYYLITNWLARRKLLAIRIKNDKQRQEYNQTIEQMTKEITDAKLRYEDSKRGIFTEQ